MKGLATALRGPGDLGGRLAPLVLALALAGCGSSAHYRAHYRPGHPVYKVGAPYEVNGEWYYPAVDYNYDRTGVASWYGEQFNERYTANGEVFDLNGLTAAHKTLPMPTIVQVTNLANGRSLRLRVNDRGPFADGRIIDVSRRAAQLLGFETQGTTPVRVEVMKTASIRAAEQLIRGNGGSRILLAAAPAAATRTPPAAPLRQPPSPQAPPSLAPAPAPAPAPPPSAEPLSSPAPPPSPRPAPRSSILAALVPSASAAPLRTAELPPRPLTAGRIFVQAAAFSQRANAQRALLQIDRLGNAAVVHTSIGGIDFYRVRLGPLSSVTEADWLLGRVVGSGYRQARIVVD